MYRNKNSTDVQSWRKHRWLCALTAILIATQVLGGVNPNAEPLAGAGMTEPNQPQVDFSDEGCMIKFIAFQTDSSIRDGLRLLAALCKKNIIPSAKVDGPLTISRLYNVTFEQALDAVLGHGFKYDQDGDFVRVYSADEYKKIKTDPERMVHKVITLYYITAEEAGKLIQPVVSDSAKIQTSTAAEEQITAGGGGGGSAGGLSGGGGGDNMAINDMIVLYDYPENIEKAEAVIASVDVRPKQVLIEATIMAARLTETTQFGIDWNLLSGVLITDYPPIPGGQGTPIETFGFANPLGTGLTVGFSADNVKAIITALEEITDTTLLANPKILAVNKQEGAVLIGNKLGYRSGETITEGGVSQSTVEFLETGTRLVFRPYIGDDGYIRMDIYPKDSDGQVSGDGLPSERTAELRTNVIVKDGQTVVLGGLFRDSVITGREQVPVLGNLPVVGALFRSTTDTSQREEVIIMLTPHIIEEPSETNADDRAADVRMKADGAKHTIQAFSRPRLAEEAYDNAAQSYLDGDLEQAMFNLRIALMIRPTYLDALRLRERIIAETDPEEYKRIDSIVRYKLDKEEAENWRRP